MQVYIYIYIYIYIYSSYRLFFSLISLSLDVFETNSMQKHIINSQLFNIFSLSIESTAFICEHF